MSRNRDRRAPPEMTRSPMVRVSDHALVRFLERAGHMNVELVRASLEAGLARSAAAAKAMGQTEYLITANGHTFVVRNETVTTVLVGQSVCALDHVAHGLPGDIAE